MQALFLKEITFLLFKENVAPQVRTSSYAYEAYLAVKPRYVNIANIELHINVPAEPAFLTEAETLFSG